MNDRIGKLERLAKRKELVAPIIYDNPERNDEIFYDFVKRYANVLGMSVREEKLDLIGNIKFSLKNIGRWCRKKDGLAVNKILPIAEFSLRASLLPMIYPIWGGGWSVEIEKNEITIYKPSYHGIRWAFSINHKVHEYLHAHNMVLVRDLRERELTEIDAVYDINFERITPFFIRKAPTYESLKRFERRIIEEVIKKERKNSAS